MFFVGDTVAMTNEALENYGEKWRGTPLKVTHRATKYMPAAQFFPTRPAGYHPGYDEAANGRPLYDLATLEGEDLPWSLYYWEVRGA